jgi:hypothetical protein
MDMQNNGIIFSSYEQQIMQDTEFLRTKWEVMEKVSILLSKLQRMTDLSRLHRPKFVSRQTGLEFQGPKISRGENYNGLPYMVLDHPRYFSQESVFTFRCMFLWGQCWSFTLHLQGTVLEQVKAMEASTFELETPVYVSSGESAWEYHYGEDNYRLFAPKSGTAIKEFIAERPFVKFSEKIPLSTHPDDVIQYGFEAYERMMRILQKNSMGI